MRLSRTSVVLTICFACFGLSIPAHAELNAYLRLKGEKSGDVKGSVTQKGREGAIMVIAMTHEIVSPRDAASGMATGKRVHKPLVITKELDRSTPILRQIFVTNENIPTFTLEFYRPRSATGAEEKYLTIKLTNASIASILQVMPNNKDPNLMKFAQYEEVAFTYKKIEWTWVDGGISSSDEWSAPR